MVRYWTVRLASRGGFWIGVLLAFGLAGTEGFSQQATKGEAVAERLREEIRIKRVMVDVSDVDACRTAAACIEKVDVLTQQAVCVLVNDRTEARIWFEKRGKFWVCGMGNEKNALIVPYKRDPETGVLLDSYGSFRALRGIFENFFGWVSAARQAGEKNVAREIGSYMTWFNGAVVGARSAGMEVQQGTEADPEPVVKWSPPSLGVKMKDYLAEQTMLYRVDVKGDCWLDSFSENQVRLLDYMSRIAPRALFVIEKNATPGNGGR
ncbi:MAG: hypothetical protein PHV34_24885 [Verrucomicrobiae bacterium]|nr:hypothetical protein [Verrucomicrobiae bacterium]